MRPHIAVNTRLLLPGRIEGISRFAEEVLRRMVLAHPEVQFSFFFDRKYDNRFIFAENVTPYIILPQARHPMLWYTWFHITAKNKLNKLKPDVFFSPEFYLIDQKRIPQVAVFHDLAYEHYPEDISPWAARYCKKYSPYYAKLASHICTVSAYSKQDIMYHYQVSAEKISVVYNGASTAFSPLPLTLHDDIREKFTNGKPYFLFVGTIQPRKNIETLLKAFDRFKDEQPSEVKLLIVGRRGWHYREALETYQLMQHRDDVMFTGFVEDGELPALYAASLALCYIPYLEGFGIPLLEAMNCDTAILCSNVASLPEVVGEAAYQVDPFEIDQVVKGMQKLCTDPLYRTGLIVKGRTQRQKYNWDLTAHRTWSIISNFL